jgi:hypothetical protein
MSPPASGEARRSQNETAAGADQRRFLRIRAMAGASCEPAATIAYNWLAENVEEKMLMRAVASDLIARPQANDCFHGLCHGRAVGIGHHMPSILN